MASSIQKEICHINLTEPCFLNTMLIKKMAHLLLTSSMPLQVIKSQEHDFESFRPLRQIYIINANDPK